MKTKKIIEAGPYRQEILYDRVKRSDPPKVRAAKHRATTEAMKRQNRKDSRTELMLRLASAFPTAGSGILCVLTYRDGCVPKSWKEAKSRVNAFRKAMRKARKARGQKFLMASNTEEHSARMGRIHHHAVINNTGEDYDLIRSCWKWGDVIEFSKLRVDKEKNWATLAAYMTKEEPPHIGEHGWTCTRNCPKPTVETFTVDDDTTLQAPRGAHVIAEERHRNEWTGWSVIEYVWPAGSSRPPRAKRRRR